MWPNNGSSMHKFKVFMMLSQWRKQFGRSGDSSFIFCREFELPISRVKLYLAKFHCSCIILQTSLQLEWRSFSCSAPTGNMHFSVCEPKHAHTLTQAVRSSFILIYFLFLSFTLWCEHRMSWIGCSAAQLGAALNSNTRCVLLVFQLFSLVQRNAGSFYCSTSTTTSSDCRSCIRSSVSMPLSQHSGSRGRVACLRSFSPFHSEENGPSTLVQMLVFPQSTSVSDPHRQSHSKLRACAVGFLFHQMHSRHPWKAQRIF